MRTVVRNSFARHTIRAERVTVNGQGDESCHECGSVRMLPSGRKWLYRFHVDDDSGPRHSGPISDGRLFCSRSCAEAYTGRSFDETK
jgi:hypothetical protein